VVDEVPPPVVEEVPPPVVDEVPPPVVDEEAQTLKSVAQTVLDRYTKKPTKPENIQALREVAGRMGIFVEQNTPHSEIANKVSEALQEAPKPLSKGIQVGASEVKEAPVEEAPVEGLTAIQKEYAKHVNEGTLDYASDEVKDFNNELRKTNKPLWDIMQNKHTKVLNANEKTKALAAEQRVAESDRLDREAKAETDRLEREAKKANLAAIKKAAEANKVGETESKQAGETEKKVDASLERETLEDMPREGDIAHEGFDQFDYSDDHISEQGEHDYFSVSDKAEPTGHTAESLAKTLSPEMKRLVASGKAVIHNTVADLMKAVPGKHPENVQGLTTKEGVAHFVADKLHPESLERVALHEVGVHAGMENLVGPEVYKDITHQALNNVGPAFDKARASIPKDTPAHLRHHEALAYLVENAPHLPVVRKLISAVRNFARTTLGIKVKLTEADAKHLALRALRKESKTAERTARKEGTAYSTKAKPQSAAWEQVVKEAKERVDEEGNAKPLTSSEKPRLLKDELHTILKDGLSLFSPSKFKSNVAAMKGAASEVRRVAVSKNDPLTRVLHTLDTISEFTNKKGQKVSQLRADLIKDQADQGLNFATTVAKLGAPHINEVGVPVIKDNLKSADKNNKGPLSVDSLLEGVAAKDKEKPGYLQVFSDILRINVGEHRLKEHAIGNRIAIKDADVKAQEDHIKNNQATMSADELAKAQDKLFVLKDELTTLKDNETRINEINTEMSTLDKDINKLDASIATLTGKALKTAEKDLKGLIADRRSLKNELSKLTGPERMVTDADIAWRDKVLKDPDNASLLHDIADTKTVLDSIVTFEEQAGMYDSKQAKKFRDDPYAPLYKSLADLEDVYGDTPNQGGKAMPMGNVKKVRHSEQTVNMAENLKRRVQRGVVSGIINNTKKVAVQQMKKIDTGLAMPISRLREERLTTAQKARLLRLREDGRDRLYLIEDPHLLETLSFTRPLMHPVMDMLTAGTSLIRTTALQTPSFFMRQLPGEIASALLISGTKHGRISPKTAFGAIPVAKMIKNMATSMVGKNSYANTLEKHGLIVGIHDFVEQLSHSYEGLEKPMHILSPKRLPLVGRGTIVGKGVGWGLNALKRVAGGIDAGVRAHVFEMAMMDAKENGLKGEAAETYAVNRARQFINFSASGTSDKINLYRKAYLFSGASLNSMDALIKNATGYGLSKKEADVAKKMFRNNVIALGSASASITIYQMLNDPERYKQFMRDEANANAIMLPDILGKNDESEGVSKLTIPFEAGFIINTLPSLAIQSVFHAISDETGLEPIDVIKRLWRQALSTVIPPSPIDINEKGEIRVHAPSGVSPIVEGVSGYSAYRGTNIESAAQLNLPAELRESKSSPIANRVAAGINSMLPERWEKLSPVKADYILRGYFSDWYGMANAVLNGVSEEETNPKSVVENWPILRSVDTNPNKLLEAGKAFDFAEEVGTQQAAFKYFESRGDVEKIKEFIDSPYHKMSMGFAEDVSKLKKQLGEYKKDEEVISGHKLENKEATFKNIKQGQQKVVDQIIQVRKLWEKRIAAEEAKKSNSRK
jgi:hypothetical protein